MTVRRPIPVDELLGRMRGRAANTPPPPSSVREVDEPPSGRFDSDDDPNFVDEPPFGFSEEPTHAGEDDRPKTGKRFPTVSEVILSLGVATTRLPTGIDTLDAATRGGIPFGRRLTLQGPPGVGKTSFAIQIARIAVEAGAAVAVLAADEEDEGLACRWAQSLGFARDDLEKPHGDEIGDATRARAAEACKDLPVIVVDADKHDATIEDVSAALVELRGARNSVLIIDSAQTARSAEAQTDDGPRARVDRVVRAFKIETKRRNHLGVLLSEVGRGLYRSRAKSDRIDALAGAKESSSVEYATHVLLSLASVPNEGGVIEVEMPKNRLGQKRAFRLRQDFARCTLSELPMPEESTGDAPESKPRPRVRIAEVANIVRRILLAKPGIAGRSAVRAAVRDTSPTPIGNDSIDAAIDDLRRSSELDEQGPKNRPRWFLRQASGTGNEVLDES